MATYKIFDFMMTGDIFTGDNYSIDEYREFISHFDLIPFQVDGNIKCLHFILAQDSASRVCNGYAYRMSYDEIMSSGMERFPRPEAFLTLTLWRNGDPEINVVENPN
jgi:hypothetical protein